jgi:hypothetical protein
MDNIPLITLQVRGIAENVTAALMLRREEVGKMIEAGVERAVSDAPDAIIDAAADEANKAIRRVIENYFHYGPGHEAIKEAVETALEPIRKALSKGARK